MNTDEHRSEELSTTSRRLVDLISVHRCSYVARFSVALLFGCAFCALMLSPSDASTGVAQTQKLTEKLKDPQFIADGAKLFAPNCGSGYCHGAGGIGGGAPRLRGKDLDPQYIFKTVSYGISGTAMLSFKSDFSEEEIWKLVAFILSDGKVNALPEPSPTKPYATPTSAPAHPDTAPAGTLAGSAQAGKALFFDSAQSKSCHQCHAFNKEGEAVGPDLSQAGNKSARELFSLTLVARSAQDSRYAVLTLVLKNGDKIIGVKKEEDAESVRVYDITELPAVLRTVQKNDLSKSETVGDWPVHKDNASLYTIKQLLDLVTFLKSFESKSPVTLADIL